MTGVGIVSYGFHVPWYRLSRKTISSSLGALGKGSGGGDKAVANFDEDSISMAVGAGIDSLKDMTDRQINGVLFASTTAPYLERESASIIATALDLGSDVRTADFTDACKAGTSAILFACDTVRADGKGTYLVCGSDSRLGVPGSGEETTFGDGAGAVTIGTEGVIATLEGYYTLSYDFPDYRRLDGDKFVRSVEDRFAREEGYGKIIPEAIAGFLKKYNMEAKDFARVAYACPNARVHASIGKGLGFTPEQILPSFLKVTGELGTAFPNIALTAVLEEAKPGDNILIVGYGSGAEVLFFKVTGEIEKVANRGRFQKALETNEQISSYDKYLAFRKLITLPVLQEPEANTQLPLVWRNRRSHYALHGTKCKVCGTAQYPPQRICVNPDCLAVDQMEDYSFADKNATLFSSTIDHASPYVNPPLLYGYIDFDGGGRFVFEITDCNPDELKPGMPMRMSFRRKYIDEVRGIVGYFWKATPKRD
jgi:3-hydroxy-3-methylglutaryl CoA synthase